MFLRRGGQRAKKYFAKKAISHFVKIIVKKKPSLILEKVSKDPSNLTNLTPKKPSGHFVKIIVKINLT